MNRRGTVLALLALGGAPFALRAQQQAKAWRVGFLNPRSRPDDLAADNIGGFIRGMRELGYVEGRNLAIEWRFADGKFERLPAMAAELAQLKVDVIVTAGNQSISAAQKASSSIPIVIATSIDPVGSGFVASLARPGGNITGLSNMASELSAKHLEMLLSVVPKLARVAVLVNPSNTAHAAILKSVQAAAQTAGVTIVPVEAQAPQQIENAFALMNDKKAGAVIVAIDGLFTLHRRQIVELATKNRLPSIFTTRTSVEAGGLMSYGQNFAEDYRRAATYVDKIFKGARPADLPVEQSTNFELVINTKTAGAIGVTIPQAVLLRADEIIR